MGDILGVVVLSIPMDVFKIAVAEHQQDHATQFLLYYPKPP